MAKDIGVKIEGIDELKRLLAKAGTHAPKALAGPLYRFAEQYIMYPAKFKYVPVVTKALQGSIRTYGPFISSTGAYVEVGAGGPSIKYAIRVHENPRSGRTMGQPPNYTGEIAFRWIKGKVRPIGAPYKHWSRVGQWKYLETPAKAAAAKPGPLIAGVGREVEKLFGRR